MKKSKYALIALLTALAANSASAQSMSNKGYYGEIGYTAMTLKNTTNGFDATPKLARLTVGKDINENLSVEAMYAASISNGNSLGTDVSADAYGIFLKPKMEVAKDAEVFARVGWVHVNEQEKAGGVSRSFSDSGAAYGFGIQSKFTNNFYGQLDYMNYYDKDAKSAKGFTVSIGTSF